MANQATRPADPLLRCQRTGRAGGQERVVAKLVYSFADGKAEGRTAMKDVLGGKGANLAEMTNLGIPVPAGFTISTRACNQYIEQGYRIPKELETQVGRALRKLERAQGRKFGDVKNPLLVSVRSGAKFSMPGMMDTILNLGLNDRAVKGLAAGSGNARFAYDSYRRFIQMYGDVVLEIPKHEFESRLAKMKKARRAASDTDLAASDLERLCEQFKAVVKKASGRAFPQDPTKQLWGSIAAVFRSWNNDRAKRYRREYGIADNLGTGVNVQAMVFGNLGDDCATGVAFTRNPATGANELYGEYLLNAQGEDVVAGIRTPLPISKSAATDGTVSLEEVMPEAYRELQRIRRTLERHYRDMQDVEFTIERGKLYMLQTRTGKRTGVAALNIAHDLNRARTINREEAVRRVEPDMLVQLLAPIFDQSDLDKARRSGRVVARGLPAGPGAANGCIAFDAESAEQMAAAGRSVLLVRSETSPEDIGGMVASAGILTTRGGMTSHAAVVARGMGKPCIVGADGMQVDEGAGKLRLQGRTLKKGDELSIDGTTGEVILGHLDPRPSEIQQVLVDESLPAERSPLFRRFRDLMRWADSIRTLKVRTNADTPHDSSVARAFGAQGIGLCRTEHMFFGEDRILAVRKMILAETLAERRKALKQLLPMQRKDFDGIFKAMDGLPVTVRLLDPPLHEFLPTSREQFRVIAKETGHSPKSVQEKVDSLQEANPMLGHRGCRLGLTFPEIYEMQVQAIMEAACARKKRGTRVHPEIMIPLVGTTEEYRQLEQRVRVVADAVCKKRGQRVRYHVGTMIEVPRACLVADQIAGQAEFFSFGTNDLTQMTYGYSRDDIGKFLPEYLEQRILEADPFQTVDQDGVGELIRGAVDKGRQANDRLKIGVCGEHGGDPRSVGFFHVAGVDYVSCSPFRVPVARLAAAHAALHGTDGGSGTA
ncbi:MAG: pyruvate, phosphate dikinase [bacterium]|nr:pyruvate, phosphate dikinase [bacterium]